MDINKKAWVVSADMGYGHQRAVYPLREFAEEKIINVGSSEAVSKNEKKLWKKILNAYESFSRAKSIPVVGNIIFNILDSFLHIPSFYPKRNLSHPTFQVNLLESSIKKGLCSGMLAKISTKNLPIITSFYASAVAADLNSDNEVYCIICDTDLNRVWVAKNPEKSNIKYFAPCGKAVQRLRAYGVSEEKIFLTGFPLPDELIGGEDLEILKKNLAQRLLMLDPKRKFWQRNEANIIKFLGFNPEPEMLRTLTLLYSVGGAGAQKEIGGKIIKSLKEKILNNEIKIYLAAGIKFQVKEYFDRIKSEVVNNSDNVEIIYAEKIEDYFSIFNNALNKTDILWTKPSELTFYSALGIPIIMTPPIGSQEKFNAKWLREIQAGIKQENPDYTNQWLFDWLRKGHLAEAAWEGFLKARKLGTYKIKEVLERGKLSKDKSPVLR